MKITNLNLNNKEDKVKLLSIIYSNLEGDLTDSETEEQINNINNSSDDNNFIFSSKNLHNKVAIKVLSIKDYENYIINGTADGSITKSDDNVWHKLVPQNYSNDLFINWGAENRTVNYYTYFENCSDNTLDITPRKYTYSIALGACYYGSNYAHMWNRVSRTSTDKDKKNVSIVDSNITAYKGSSTNNSSFDNINDSSYYVGIRVYYKEYKTFRPCFSIIDNNKSANLFS